MSGNKAQTHRNRLKERSKERGARMDRIEEKKKLTEDYNGRKKNEGHGQAVRSARRDGDEKRNLLETIPAEWGMAATFLTGSGRRRTVWVPGTGQTGR